MKKKRREPALQKIKISILQDNGDFESTNRGIHTKAKSRESLVTVGPSKIQDTGHPFDNQKLLALPNDH
jgi:hypothetical protein